MPVLVKSQILQELSLRANTIWNCIDLVHCSACTKVQISFSWIAGVIFLFQIGVIGLTSWPLGAVRRVIPLTSYVT